MAQMIGELEKSVVPVMLAREGGQQLLGTAIMVSDSVAITCKHVIDSGESYAYRDEASRFQGLGVRYGSTMFYCCSPPLTSESWDLGCMYLERLPNAVPAKLLRTPPVKALALSAIGFKLDMSGPRPHLVRNLQVLIEEQYGEILQSSQFDGAAMAGFSGGPVLAETNGAWGVIGMLYSGGEKFQVSRMIAVDPIVTFLRSKGVEVSASDFVPPRPQPVSGNTKASVKSGRDIICGDLDIQGTDASLEAGRDIVDTCAKVYGVSPRTDK